ncbi:hypothetical protein [Paracoccus homiensis]|uniref:hypothetical protein n=1 Tax=Paracoccus homiensis TaxID=364199 RepID=UPI001FDF942A|nr:hypothetical protein [Paracoccus homiensis]
MAIALPLHGDAHDPAPGTGWVDDMVEAIAVAVPPWAEGAHEILGQFAEGEGHRTYHLSYHGTNRTERNRSEKNAISERE